MIAQTIHVSMGAHALMAPAAIRASVFLALTVIIVRLTGMIARHARAGTEQLVQTTSTLLPAHVRLASAGSTVKLMTMIVL